MLIDCVTSPPADAMRTAGVTGVSRYLSWADARDTLRKVIHQAEYDGLRAAGFDVLLNWEYDSEDWLGGATAGAAHAAEAVRQARALGYPAGNAIPGSADFDMTHTQWNGPCWAYAKAYSQGIRGGGYRAGVYGPWDVLEWCATTGWFDIYWQAGMSTSWSGGRNAQLWPGAHLRQRRSGFIAGYDVDFNDILQDNYGQQAVDAASTGDDMLKDEQVPTYQVDDQLQTHQTGTLDGASVLGFTNAVAWKVLGEVEDVKAKVAALSTPTVDLDALAAKVAALLKPPTAAEIAKAVNDDAAARLQQ